MDWSLLGFKGLNQVFNIHPVFIHFPIALFPTALFFYFIGIVYKRSDLTLAGQICLGLSLAGAALSVLTGYLAHEDFPHGETIHRMMETHQIIGFAILALAVVLMIWSFLKREGIPKASSLFLVLFGLTTLATLQNADLGARMVFVEGAAVKAMPRSDEGNHDHHHGEGTPEKETVPHDYNQHDHHH